MCLRQLCVMRQTTSEQRGGGSQDGGVNNCTSAALFGVIFTADQLLQTFVRALLQTRQRPRAELRQVRDGTLLHFPPIPTHCNDFRLVVYLRGETDHVTEER
ncbi:hypothetical protein F2P81_025875 [Scophthalmus maximus]|uniref:Uncharacterized protein n=1 Tax=Scophthalmus maximus TaxID=52904 RepID=A0A6A4RS72_SCOMX|nr:hypothetical protein F2P81_025875 [Scophthalmus maximus]